MGISTLFAFSKTKRKKKKKKVDAARFLDARGDEKQVINLERPNVDILIMIRMTRMCEPAESDGAVVDYAVIYLYMSNDLLIYMTTMMNASLVYTCLSVLKVIMVASGKPSLS